MNATSRLIARIAVATIGFASAAPLCADVGSRDVGSRDVGSRDVGSRDVDSAIKRLVDAASVYDEPAMRESVERLARIGRSSLPSLARLLKHEDANVRWQAVLAIDRIGEPDGPLRRPLVVCTRDQDADVRGAAVVALAHLFPQQAQTRDAIKRLRDDPQPLVRVLAHGSDWRTTKNPRSLAELLKALREKDWMAASEASQRLARIGEPAAAGLIALLKDENTHVRVAALRTLAATSPPPVGAIDHLAELARSDNRLLSYHALQALANCGPRGWFKVRELCRSPSTSTRALAVRILGRSNGKGKEEGDEVLPLLRACLADAEGSVRLAALESIRQLGVADGRLVETLKNTLTDRRPDHRAATVAALRSLGSAARPAVPSLRVLARDEKVDYIRRAAREALRRLEP